MATSKKPTRQQFAANLKKAQEKTNKAAEEATKKAKAAAETAKAKAKKAATGAAAAAKKKTEEVSAKVKEAAKKPAPAKKAPAKKAAPKAKAADAKVTTTVQWYGKDYKVNDLIEKAEAAFKEEYKKPLKKIEIYIKPEDNRVYYVANGDSAGSVEL